MSKIEDRVIDLSEKLEALALKMGPDVYEATLSATRVSGVAVIVEALILIILSSAAIMLGYYFFKQDNKYPNEGYDLLVGLFIGVSAFVLIVSVCFFISVWRWVAIFNPELYLIHKFLGV